MFTDFKCRNRGNEKTFEKRKKTGEGNSVNMWKFRGKIVNWNMRNENEGFGRIR